MLGAPERKWVHQKATFNVSKTMAYRLGTSRLSSASKPPHTRLAHSLSLVASDMLRQLPA